MYVPCSRCSCRCDAVIIGVSLLGVSIAGKAFAWWEVVHVVQAYEYFTPRMEGARFLARPFRRLGGAMPCLSPSWALFGYESTGLPCTQSRDRYIRFFLSVSFSGRTSSCLPSVPQHLGAEDPEPGCGGAGHVAVRLGSARRQRALRGLRGDEAGGGGVLGVGG